MTRIFIDSAVTAMINSSVKARELTILAAAAGADLLHHTGIAWAESSMRKAIWLSIKPGPELAEIGLYFS
jgi:hypothetical protein